MAINSTRKVLLRLDPSYKRCPSCGDVNTLRRSRAKNFYENVLKVTRVYKMYRCRKCNWRGPISTLIITKQTLRNLAIYIAMVLLTLFIVSRAIGNITS